MKPRHGHMTLNKKKRAGIKVDYQRSFKKLMQKKE
jgi:hypothetical protein